MLHYSRYNRLVEIPGGNKAIYNLVSGKKLLLQGFVETLYNSVLDAPESRLAKKWQEQGFLAEGDELQKLKLLHYADQNQTANLKLIICPTRSCNFRCPYCFEEHESGCMSKEVQAKLLAFVQRFMEEKHPQTFNVSWFGGEPLLYPQIIEYLSAEFIRLCAEYKVAYRADILTNGYLLNQRLVDMLEQAKVRVIKITLDGPKAQNDATRVLADGSGSYDVIMGNLRTIKTRLHITVRCNLTRENRDCYEELAEIIRALRAETGTDISCYPGYLTAEAAADKSHLKQQSLDFISFLEKEKSAMLQSLQDFRFLPCSCYVQQVASFVVRDDGTLCKCTNDISYQERTVANLMEDSNPLLAQFQSEWGQKYLGLDVFADEECCACQLLPVCGGGCPARRLHGLKHCQKKLARRLDELIRQSFDSQSPTYAL